MTGGSGDCGALLPRSTGSGWRKVYPEVNRTSQVAVTDCCSDHKSRLIRYVMLL